MCDENVKKLCIFPISLLLEVKRLKKIGTGGLKKIKHFYLSQPITLHLQTLSFSISAFVQSDREYLSFSIPMPGNIYLFLSLSLSAD